MSSDCILWQLIVLSKHFPSAEIPAPESHHLSTISAMIDNAAEKKKKKEEAAAAAESADGEQKKKKKKDKKNKKNKRSKKSADVRWVKCS